MHHHTRLASLNTARPPPLFDLRTHCHHLLCVLTDSFLNTHEYSFPPLQPPLFLTSNHQQHCLQSPPSLTNVSSLQVAQCLKATPIPTTSNSLAITHQSSSWPPRYAISFLFLTATGAHPTQPDSFHLGGRQDTQQVVLFIIIVVNQFTIEYLISSSHPPTSKTC